MFSTKRKEIAFNLKGVKYDIEQGNEISSLDSSRVIVLFFSDIICSGFSLDGDLQKVDEEYHVVVYFSNKDTITREKYNKTKKNLDEIIGERVKIIITRVDTKGKNEGVRITEKGEIYLTAEDFSSMSSVESGTEILTMGQWKKIVIAIFLIWSGGILGLLFKKHRNKKKQEL